MDLLCTRVSLRYWRWKHSATRSQTTWQEMVLQATAPSTAAKERGQTTKEIFWIAAGPGLYWWIRKRRRKPASCVQGSCSLRPGKDVRPPEKTPTPGLPRLEQGRLCSPPSSRTPGRFLTSQMFLPQLLSEAREKCLMRWMSLPKLLLSLRAMWLLNIRKKQMYFWEPLSLKRKAWKSWLLIVCLRNCLHRPFS